MDLIPDTFWQRFLSVTAYRANAAVSGRVIAQHVFIDQGETVVTNKREIRMTSV